MRHTNRTIINLVVVLTLMLAFATPSFAQRGGPNWTATPMMADSTFAVTGPKTAPVVAKTASSGLVSVVVKLKGEPLATYGGGVSGLAPTSPRVTGAPQLDTRSKDSQAYLQHLAKLQSAFEAKVKLSAPQAKTTHRFDVLLNAVAMIVPSEQVKTLAALPEVEAIYPDELLQLDTENSPQFIGAPTVWSALGGQEKAGEGVIVGVIDTGIWPEHPSFSDPDPSGKPYAAPPAPPSGVARACQFSGGGYPGAPFTCNNKLIGAYRFMATYDAYTGIGPGEYTTARDDDGHGTHTSSTAAGNANVAARVFGVARGTISGIAPRAHVITYKVCGAAGCYSSDSAAAVQQAIKDGVNVINFSISGGANPFSDAVELAFLQAYDTGIFVAASAGNAGPTPETTDHRGPWVTTVAASTQNRAFENTATITADGGASLTLRGTSITGGVGPAPVVLPPAGLELCGVGQGNPFSSGQFTGKIVVCKRGTSGRAEKGYNVSQAGAVGMILYNQSAAVTDVETDNHYLPTIHIQFADGTALLNFIAANTNVKATLTQGAKASAQGDVMASFSSRGGPKQSLGVSKPDITAPGVQILAGHSPAHRTPAQGGVALGPQGELFQAIAGTSMSSPHIAGAGALIKALHPDWTPGKIKSALMTTAWTQVVKEDGATPANAFDYGSGRVDLTKAGSAGLTFDETAANYVAYKNDLWNANYPSVYVPGMPGIVTVQRTAHSELRQTSCWQTSVDAPSDVKVIVPPVICVKGGGDQTFSITIDGHDVPLGETRFATLNFKFGQQRLHMPLTFVRKQPVVTLAKTCDPATIAFKGTTSCTITMQNNSFDAAGVSLVDTVPMGLLVDRNSVVGGSVMGNLVTFQGSLAGAQPPDVKVNAGSANGYLSLAALGATSNVTMGDETIVNFSLSRSFIFAGKTYSRIGMVSNGYAVVGGGTGADVQYINPSLPNAAAPNNVLAPFWTDLDGSAGGKYYAYTLSDGAGHYWLVMEWEQAPNFSTTPKANTFQIWIGFNGVEDISFAYGPALTAGEGGALTVGAENEFGNRGQNYYYNGAGTRPTAGGNDVIVTSVAGAPGETHTVTFSATGYKPGEWTNCAALTGDIFFGTSTACFTGNTNKP